VIEGPFGASLEKLPPRCGCVKSSDREDNMHAIKNCDFARLILGAGVLAASVALLPHAAAAQDKTAGGHLM